MAEELLAYNRSRFAEAAPPPLERFPLPSAPHVAAWRTYAEEARTVGAVAALTRRLVQLRFPVREHISATEPYRAVTRRGVDPDEVAEATGLALRDPEGVRVFLHPTPAGEVPVVVARDRTDFEALLRALGSRNEPVPIPPAQGASTIAGLNNWDRIRTHRACWAEAHPDACTELDWQAEFRRLRADRSAYQDELIVLAEGPYSGVDASALGLTEEAWRAMSLTIRLEHECTHYVTRRLFGSMNNLLFDELLADYRGLVHATGAWRETWFLRFLGLEETESIRPGGRLWNYRGSPPLGEEAFEVLGRLARSAARGLTTFDRAHGNASRTATDDVAVLLALCTLTLEDLAADDGAERMARALEGVRPSHP